MCILNDSFKFQTTVDNSKNLSPLISKPLDGSRTEQSSMSPIDQVNLEDDLYLSVCI